MWGDAMEVIHHESGVINHIDIVLKTPKPINLDTNACQIHKNLVKIASITKLLLLTLF
jgi:hypothetical protein